METTLHRRCTHRNQSGRQRQRRCRRRESREMAALTALLATTEEEMAAPTALLTTRGVEMATPTALGRRCCWRGRQGQRPRQEQRNVLQLSEGNLHTRRQLPLQPPGGGAGRAAARAGTATVGVSATQREAGQGCCGTASLCQPVARERENRKAAGCSVRDNPPHARGCALSR